MGLFLTSRTMLITSTDVGVPYNVTQRRAGHSTARMTMERYSHRSTEADKDAAAALQGYFSDAFSDEEGTDRARRASGTPFRRT